VRVALAGVPHATAAGAVPPAGARRSARTRASRNWQLPPPAHTKLLSEATNTERTSKKRRLWDDDGDAAAERRQLKRQMREQAKEIQKLQALILENQRLMMGAPTMPTTDAWLTPATPPMISSTTIAPPPASAPPPVATPPPPVARGVMPEATRRALCMKLQTLCAADLKRALVLAGDANAEELDLGALADDVLWSMHDFCDAARAAAAAAKPPRKRRNQRAVGWAARLEEASAATERRLEEVRAARAAIGAGRTLAAAPLADAHGADVTSAVESSAAGSEGDACSDAEALLSQLEWDGEGEGEGEGEDEWSGF